MLEQPIGKRKRNIVYFFNGLLTLTCQVARRQETAGVGGGAIWGRSWVARAYIYICEGPMGEKWIKTSNSLSYEFFFYDSASFFHLNETLLMAVPPLATRFP